MKSSFKTRLCAFLVMSVFFLGIMGMIASAFAEDKKTCPQWATNFTVRVPEGTISGTAQQMVVEQANKKCDIDNTIAQQETGDLKCYKEGCCVNNSDDCKLQANAAKTPETAVRIISQEWVTRKGKNFLEIKATGSCQCLCPEGVPSPTMSPSSTTPPPTSPMPPVIRLKPGDKVNADCKSLYDEACPCI